MPSSVSDGYDKDDVAYIWTHGVDNSIKMASDMTLSQFDLIGFPAGNESQRKAGTLSGMSELCTPQIQTQCKGYVTSKKHIRQTHIELPNIAHALHQNRPLLKNLTTSD